MALPSRQDPSKLRNSYLLAEKRLVSLENHLEKSPELQKMYNSIVQEYLDQGHMSIVLVEQDNSPSYHIPTPL